ncbi:MAG: Unknown protein [uncultured Aureispira sp.]|uniref:Uncharacterized protein n=1 Tax=uncultured Aureispira sp. TaxID=1331704 RepID=A0A6S6TTB8_9BACT|nr:MAG: Unknown protein [uncultured Aureispira sp.]
MHQIVPFMYKSKLITIFKALPTTQKRQFRKWLISPIHNQHQDVVKLFDFIYTKRNLSPKSISKEQAYQYLYGTTTYKDSRMRHVMSFALETLNRFVSYSQIQKDSFLNDFSLIKGYRELQLDKYAAQSLDKIKKQQKNKSIKNSTFFLQNYQLEQEFFEQKSKQQRTNRINLKEVTRPFTTLFIIHTLKYACISQTHSNLRKEAYQIPLLEAVLEEIKGGYYTEIDAIMIYYHSYWALTLTDAEKHFVKLKEYLLRDQPVLNLIDLKDLYLAALNYCIKKLNIGEEEYVIEALEIYKMGLRTKILLEENKLSRFAYKNITALGLRAKDFDWIRDFIETYAAFVEPKYRTSYKHYNTAKLHFEQGNQSKAMELLLQVEYDDIFLNLDAKIILLKIYFANKDYEAMTSLLDSTRVYLGRKSKSVMSYHQENYKNILRFTQKISSLSPYNKKAKSALIEEIKTIRPLTERQWLLSALSQH